VFDSETTSEAAADIAFSVECTGLEHSHKVKAKEGNYTQAKKQTACSSTES
jgi:hypothetical protein